MLLDMRSTTALYLGSFAISSSFMTVFPLLPALQERADVPTAQLGLVAAAGFVAALVAQLLIAPHADRGRHRAVINGAVLVMAASSLLYIVMPNLTGMVLARIGAGLAYGAFIPTAIGLLVRAYPDTRGARIGRLQALNLAGVAVGPLIAVVAEITIGLVPTLVLTAVLTVVAGYPVLTHRYDIIETSAGHPTTSLWSSIGMLRHRSVLGAALLVSAYMIPIGAYDALYPLFMKDIGAPDWLLGVALAMFAIPAGLLATWAGRFADRRGPFTAGLRGGLANVSIIFLYGIITAPFVIAGIGLVESGGQAVLGAAASAAMGWAVPGRRAVTAQGLGEATGTIAGAAIALASAPLYAAGGPPALFFTTAAITLLVLITGVRLGSKSTPIESPASQPADTVGSHVDAVPR